MFSQPRSVGPSRVPSRNSSSDAHGGSNSRRAADTGGFRISSATYPLRELKLRRIMEAAPARAGKPQTGEFEVVLPDGRAVLTSKRFWDSFSSRFDLEPQVFNYFEPQEVAARVGAKARPNEVISVGIEERGSASGGGTELKALAIAPFGKIQLPMDDTVAVLNRLSVANMDYADGVLSVMVNAPFQTPVHIGDSEFRQQLAVDIPLDGFGDPSVSLAMLRMVCLNGASVVSREFTTTVQLGRERSRTGIGQREFLSVDGALSSLYKALASYSDEDGFHAIKERIASSQTARASLGEYRKLATVMDKALRMENFQPAQRQEIAAGLRELSGLETANLYGLTADGNGTTVTEKASRVVPVECTIYDLLNFASEVATHRFKSQTSKERINSWWGAVLSNEYDLEGVLMPRKGGHQARFLEIEG